MIFVKLVDFLIKTHLCNQKLVYITAWWNIHINLILIDIKRSMFWLVIKRISYFN